MDIGTFSTGDLEPYAVDGAWLQALRGRLMDLVAPLVDADTFSTETTVTFRPDRHSEIERKDPTGAILSDGSVPSPEAVQIVAGGMLAGVPGWERLHASIRLRAEGGGQVYVRGPVVEARAIYDEMVAALAGRAMPRAEARRVSRIGGVGRTLANGLRASLVPIGFIAYFLGLFGAHGRAATAMVIGGLALMAGTFASWPIQSLLRDRRRKASDEADPRRTVNVIDLSRRATAPAPMLEHVVTLPTDLS